MENFDTQRLANGTAKEASKRVHDLKEGVEEVVGRVADQTSSAIDQAREAGGKAVDQLYDQGQKTINQLSAQIRREPVASVIIAAGLGILCGMLARKLSPV